MYSEGSCIESLQISSGDLQINVHNYIHAADGIQCTTSRFDDRYLPYINKNVSICT